MDGTGLLHPLLVGKFTNPRCLKNVHSLPVTYKHSKKAWMTAEIWKEWLQSLDRKMAQLKWKVLLFADNCPAHPVVPRLKAVAVHFLLPNTTAVPQPMDQGVMQCFKSWYKKLLLEKMGNALNSSINFKVDVLQAMHFAAAAWDHVYGTCAANCFRHAGWQVGSNTEDNRLLGTEEESEALCITVEAIEQLSKEEAQTPASEECPDEDIVQSILGGKELETTDAEDSDESTPVFVPNFKQCLTVIDTVKSYIHLAWKTKLCICTD